MTAPRLFELVRKVDVTGKSGTGVVAHGAQWPDGTVSLRWGGATPSFSNWDNLDLVVAVHGHGGLTYVRWMHFPLIPARPKDGDPLAIFDREDR